MSKRYFEVEIIHRAVIEADDLSDAFFVAEEKKRAILWDDEGDIEVVGEVTSLKCLPQGWSDSCIPYGGDCATRLKDLLPEEEPARDIKTIDIFAEKQDA